MPRLTAAAAAAPPQPTELNASECAVDNKFYSSEETSQVGGNFAATF